GRATRPLARLGAGGPRRPARGQRRRRPVPRLAAVAVRHRSGHPDRRRHAGRRRLVPDDGRPLDEPAAESVVTSNPGLSLMLTSYAASDPGSWEPMLDRARAADEAGVRSEERRVG